VNVRFCPACRSLILSDFRFCPYCGAKASPGPDLAEALEGPFARMEGGAAQKSREERRLAELEAELARLESDMDLLMGELEHSGGRKG
jgi:hypothetical protein